MNRNVSRPERVLRLAVGLCMISASLFWWHDAWLGVPIGWLALGMGLMMTATGASGICLMYRLLRLTPGRA